MTRISARSASVKQIKQDKTTAAHVHEIAMLNKAAKLGTVSARFFRTGSEGFYPKSKELTPERALLELMAGHEVEGTAVTWRNYRTHDKNGNPARRKVRTKVRNSKVQKFTDVKAFEKWWTAVREDTAAQPQQPTTRTRTRTRSSKHW